MTAELILHHYPASLFSEKIRAIFGFKSLTWSSVEISPIMPRPLLMPLSGGYRRTPVLQRGADVFCDTRIITDVLDAWHPRPALHPPTAGWAVRALAQRADTHLFQVAVALCFQPRAIATIMASFGDGMATRFAEDRAKLVEGSPGIATPAPDVAETHLIDELVRMEAELAATDWLCGGVPSLADFAVYHCLWFIANNEVVAPLLTPFARVRAWMQRLAGFGHGEVEALDAADALAVARDAEPMALQVTSGHLPQGVQLGDQVSVTPVDYGLVPVTGALDYVTAHHVAVLRDDPEAGAVRVHFPRAGFRIDPA